MPKRNHNAHLGMFVAYDYAGLEPGGEVFQRHGKGFNLVYKGADPRGVAQHLARTLGQTWCTVRPKKTLPQWDARGAH